MKFNKNHKVILSSLNRTEARAFSNFLKAELIRHEWAIRTARQTWVVPEDADYLKARNEFWATAVVRHEQDIDDIKKLIEVVEDKFNL